MEHVVAVLLLHCIIYYTLLPFQEVFFENFFIFQFFYHLNGSFFLHTIQILQTGSLETPFCNKKHQIMKMKEQQNSLH